MPLIAEVGKSKLRVRFLLIGIAAFLWIGVILHLYPIWWAVNTSITPYEELFFFPPPLLPYHPTLSIWKILFSGSHIGSYMFYPIWVYFKNSVIIVGGTMILQVPICALVGYSLSKLESPRYSQIMFLFFIGTILLPYQVSLIPKYLLMQSFPFIGRHAPYIPFTDIRFPSINLLNTYWAVILPASFSGFNVLLFKGFFDTIPSELINAARLDGASELSIFARIILPMSRPIFAVIAYFSFTTAWNQFMWPLIVLRDYRKEPLTLMLYRLQTVYAFIGEEQLEGVGHNDIPPMGWNLLMAISLLEAIPILIVFIIFREQLMKGIKLRGFK